jgi:bla regulator protein blaR1
LLVPALRAFRHDQELACDARVLARRPALRRAYGEAMFKAQLAAQPLPLGCHWGYGHPLKERIAMLKQPMVSPRRQRAGLVAVAALALATGFAAWAAQPKRSAPALVPPSQVQSQAEPGMDSSMLRDGEAIADRMLVVREGVPGAIRVGTLQAMSAAPSPPPAPPSPPAAPKPPVAPAPPAPPANAPDTPAVAPPPPPPPAPPVSPSVAPLAPPAPPAPPAAPAPPAIPHLPAPRYPAQAVEQKLSGRVMLLVEVGVDGRPTAIEVETANPPGVFEQEAVRAAWQWQFQPAIERGRAVPSKVQVPVDFRIDGAPPASAPEA